MAGTGKKSRGKQKIDMKRIESLEDRIATFSKRKSGIYKMASEISTTCGADAGLVIFSPTGKPWSWGCPSIEAIMNRFLNRNTGSATIDMFQAMLFDIYRRPIMDKEVGKFNGILALLERAKEKGKVLKRMTDATRDIGANGDRGWWQKSPDELTFEELKQYNAAIEALHGELDSYLNQAVNPMTEDEIASWLEELLRS